ncbi:MAG: GMC family oxidoreductase [Deltaproteobacteria bacterium]|nr:GMC family oxidoreductase [Deltaproteobacteria bacterium]
MPGKVKELEADVVVAGSGPGGATVARELSKGGKKVIVCEAGKYFTSLGKFYSAGLMMKKGGLTFSKEGLMLNIGNTVGGQSMVFAASAFQPPSWLKDRYGVDLQQEIDELYKEIPIRPLSDPLLGPGVRLLMETAQTLGMDWKPADKFIRSEKCVPNCGKCSLGCTTGAKWTAREFIDEATQNGADLLPQTKVEKVVTKSGKAAGVEAEGAGGKIVIKADIVILSAGGQGSPIILQQSGLPEAGDGFFVDPVLMVWGIAPKGGNMHDIPLSAGIHLMEDGILLMDVSFPLLLALGLVAYTGTGGLAYLRKAIHHNKLLAVMVKVRDQLYGQVHVDGSISKPIDDAAKQKLNKGVGIAKEILRKIGVKENDIFVNKPLGGHPGGSVRLGDHLDTNCQTKITNCYCVDNSIIPEPWGQPPVVTIAAMAKRLAKHLMADKKPNNR